MVFAFETDLCPKSLITDYILMHTLLFRILKIMFQSITYNNRSEKNVPHGLIRDFTKFKLWHFPLKSQVSNHWKNGYKPLYVFLLGRHEITYLMLLSPVL